jgi:adenylyl- and sulfurtransferase ThiI
VFGIHSFSPAVRLEPDFDRAAEVLAGQVRAVREKTAGETVTFPVEGFDGGSVSMLGVRIG